MTTKLCNFCGKEIPENAKICPYCNKALADKVFTYMNNKTNQGFDVSKFTKEEPSTANNYFNTNIYSFSESEIEKRFERKPIAYEEEKPIVNEEIFEKQEPIRRTPRKRRKQKNILVPFVLVLLAIVLIIILISSLFSGGKDKKQEQTTTTTTKATVKTTTTTKTTEVTTTTTQVFDTAHSVDLDGYVGVGFSGVSDHFGEQVAEPTVDEFYGGNVYYFDGMTVTTSSNGKIVSMDVDYTKVQNKDTYYYKDINYYSVYAHVVEELGEPDENLMNDQTEPCIKYVLDIGSNLVIQFKFDDNQKVSSFSMYYAD